jgi:hypothetical protein
MSEHYILCISIILFHKSSRYNWGFQIISGNSTARGHFNTRPSLYSSFYSKTHKNIYSNFKWCTNIKCVKVDTEDGLSHVKHMLSRRMCYTKKNTDAWYVPENCFLPLIVPKPSYSRVIIILGSATRQRHIFALLMRRPIWRWPLMLLAPKRGQLLWSQSATREPK